MESALALPVHYRGDAGQLALAMRQILLGSGCAIWVWVGTAGTVILGTVLFQAPALRLAYVGLILAGIAGLKLSALA
ncbi:MAG: hypothetical protein LBL59_02925 [Xanthomonadaceae bacterium]|jgi:multidrug transporter EmrE-like cation transporter|nr:hypothetical protein [Xanthomonadaceae bacterium]